MKLAYFFILPFFFGSFGHQNLSKDECERHPFKISRVDGNYSEEKYPEKLETGLNMSFPSKAGETDVIFFLFLSEKTIDSQLDPGTRHHLQQLDIIVPAQKVVEGATVEFRLNWGEQFDSDKALAKYHYFTMDNGGQAYYNTLWSNWAGHVQDSSEGYIKFTKVTESTICGELKVRVFEDSANFGTDALETGENAQTIENELFSTNRLTLEEAQQNLDDYKKAGDS